METGPNAPAVPNAIRDERLRKLYEYWLVRKSTRRYPPRRDMDPIDFRYVLARVMLVEVLRDPLRFRVRLHGTEMVQRAKYELTGRFLDELPVPEYRDYVIDQCNRVVDGGEPLLVHHNRILDHHPTRYEALWLPLGEGDNVTMLLCALIYDEDHVSGGVLLRLSADRSVRASAMLAD